MRYRLCRHPYLTTGFYLFFSFSSATATGRCGARDLRPAEKNQGAGERRRPHGRVTGRFLASSGSRSLAGDVLEDDVTREVFRTTAACIRSVVSFDSDLDIHHMSTTLGQKEKKEETKEEKKEKKMKTKTQNTMAQLVLILVFILVLVLALVQSVRPRQLTKNS